MEASNDNVSAAPTLCAEGCGFFGNPQTMGMCSKCYKSKVAKEAKAAPAAAALAPAPLPPGIPGHCASLGKEPDTLPLVAAAGSVSSQAPAWGG